MTPDNERETWREAVQAFRLAATALKDPAPALFADLSVEEGLRDLMREPPLVSFSPFDALPEGVLAGPDEQAYLSGNSGSGQIWDPATGHGTASLEAGWTRPSDSPRGPRDLPAAALSRYDEPAVSPPVFSFRRSAPMAQLQPSQRNQDMPGDSTEEAKSKPYAERFHIPEPAMEDRQQGARVDRSGAVRPGVASDDRYAGFDRGAGVHTLDERVSDHPMTLVNDLADEALEAVRSRTPDVDVRPSNTSLPQPVPSGERVIRSSEPSHEMHDRDAGPERRARDHTSGVRGSPRSVTSNRLADGFLGVAEGRAPSLFVPGSGDSPLEDAYHTERGDDLPEPDRAAYGGSAIALIDSLTEHLLPSQVRTVADLSRLDENTPEVGSSTVSGVVDHPEETPALDHSPFALLDSEHEEPTSGPTFGPAPSDTYKGAPGVASGRCMDVETFASLVNDVLVEQARRHGVDLS